MAVTKASRMRLWPGVLAWALAGLTVLTLAAGFWLAELLWSTGWEPRPSNAIAVLGAIILVTVSSWPAAGRATRWGGCCWASAWR